MARLILAVAVLLTFAMTAQAGDLVVRDGWQVHNTSKKFEDLVEAVKAAVKSAKMGLVTQASASGGAKRQGFTIPGNRVMGVYRNDFARRMLAASIPAGIEAPIRYYVTENEDGTATLSYKTPTTVFSPYFAEASEDLKVMAGELDVIFAGIAEAAIK